MGTEVGTQEAARIFASMGGNAVVAKYGKGYFKELAKKSVAARKKKSSDESNSPSSNEN